MAVFSKLFRSLNKTRNCTDQTRPTFSSNSQSNESYFKCTGLRIKAKLLQPVVALADTQPATDLMNAFGCEKRKGNSKPTVTLTLTHECVTLASKGNWALLRNGDTSFTMDYENIVSVELTERKTEVAIVCKKLENQRWCVCLKLKAIKGKGPLSRHRKITAQQLQECIETLKGTIAPHSEGLSRESSLLSVSDSFFYMDFGQTHQLQEAVDDSYILHNDTPNSIISSSVSSPIVFTPTSDQTNSVCSQKNNEEEFPCTEQPRQQDVVNYSNLLSKHTDCCIKPCSESCPMAAVETSIEPPFTEQPEEEDTIDFVNGLLSKHSDCCVKPCGSRSCPFYTSEAPVEHIMSFNNQPHSSHKVQQVPSAQQCAYYWDHVSGQYYLAPTKPNNVRDTNNFTELLASLHQLYCDSLNTYGNTEHTAHLAYQYQLYYSYYLSVVNSADPNRKMGKRQQLKERQRMNWALTYATQYVNGMLQSPDYYQATAFKQTGVQNNSIDPVPSTPSCQWSVRDFISELQYSSKPSKGSRSTQCQCKLELH